MTKFNNFKLLLTIDFEEQRRLEKAGFPNEAIEESLKGTYQIVELFEKLGIKATWFTTAAIGLADTKIFKRLVASGQEIALHALHDRDDYNKMSEDKARKRLQKAKDIVESISGQKTVGFRAPRFQHPSLKVIKDLGFKYDSSLHPSPMPGRYSGKGKLVPHVDEESGLTVLPVSVVPGLRLPLSWIWFRMLPKGYMRWGASLVEANFDYLCLYFHPWDFVDLSKYKSSLPAGFTVGGKSAINDMEDFLKWGLEKGWKSMTIQDYLD